MSRFVVAGTDTGIGKTVFAAALTGAIGATYWKPVQSGLEDGTDTDSVAALSGATPDRLLPEAYRLVTPCSPHRAAEIDGVEIDPDRLTPPQNDPLVVELAGGLMVPLTLGLLTIDLVATWGLPVILVARTALGTINHCLLSIEAMRSRGIAIHGIAFVGESVPDSEATIAAMGAVRQLGRLDIVEPLTRETLAAAFAQGFDRADFA
ncbi:dethiobiotin synthase [Sphingomonas spermidinifaciens]|uniref:ATP-dependent dethiobiotin synthetase BioD n=1 Tax=Sphingomonas spermidinifaciens TaxID=1141889 RepID=A0A2A4B6I5_9SPHN|nr:dethiobiotin synthase [Sphingomonas spermidinifaciens]PCD03572.1 dethiobiotin synthase [Sphingomonas spermidinifaciens]